MEMEVLMYKVLDKKTFKELPKKEQNIFIEIGAKQQQELFQEEESHKGLTWKDYIEDSKFYLEDKYNGQDGKESFIYKIYLIFNLDILNWNIFPIYYISSFSNTLKFEII